MTWREFLKQWLADGPWSVGAICPTSNDHAWLTSDVLDEIQAFVEQQQALQRNIYFQANLCKSDLRGARASKADVVMALCVATEIDPPEEIKTPEALEEWQRKTAEQWSDPEYWASVGLPVPSCLIFSGSGLQAFWRLSEEVQLVSVVDGALVVDREAVERVESVNRGICHAVGGDTASTGVERLLRCVGLLNYPGASKLKKGRTGPVEAELMHLDTSMTYSLDVFPRHERKVTTPTEIPSFAGLPPPEKLAEASEVLADAWPEKGRHNAFLALSGGLAQAGWPSDAVEALTVAVAQRMTGSDEKAIRDRAPMSAQTVDKVASGMVVKSWGTLVAEHGIQPATLRQVQSLLGIPDQSAPERDDAFFDALLQKHKHRALHGGPPTDLEYRARIRAEINRRSHSRDPKELAVREVYKRLLAGACLTDSPDENLEKALVDAAALLVNLSRDATIEQHERQLLGPAGRLSHEVREAIDAAIAQHDDKANQTSATEFGRNSQGEVLCSGPPLLHNFEIAVTRMGYEFKYNRFADRKLMRASADGEWDTIQDAEVNKLRFDVCKMHQFLMPKGEVFDMVSYRAHEHSFHPVLDYLDGLEAWDGIVRVGGDDQPSWLTRYCGVTDSPYTRAVGRLLLCAAVRRIRQPGCKFDEMVILEGGQGVGKCLGRDTQVLMFDGSTRAVQDIQTGDLLMGPDSTPRRVLSTTVGIGPLKRVVPTKGDPWVCNDKHVLTVALHGKGEELVDAEVTDFEPHKWGSRHVPSNKYAMQVRASTVEFESTEVFMDPYIVGLWLGDGSRGAAHITNVDPEVIDYCRQAALPSGVRCEVANYPSKGHISTIRFVGPGKNQTNVALDFFRSLADVGSEGVKRIPREFLINTIRVRQQVLAGLIDSDGYLGNNVYEIATKWADLRDDILFLARSLGLAAYSTETTKSIKSTGFSGQYHVVSISGDIDRIPVKIQRKQAHPRQQVKNVLRTGFRVEDIGEGEYFGFELDGDSRFLLGDFTVTHNSKMWRFLCPDPEWFTDDFSLKYDTKQIMEITKGKWFIECPELKGKTDGDLTHLKALLSRSTEVSRMAYGREAEERKRQFVLVGTTNESEYLLDLTGDRRYWPVEVGFIDLEALVRDRDQIWAEANHLEQQHPEETFIRLDPSLYAAAAVEQLRRRIADPHVVALSDYLFAVEGSIRLKDVWRLLGHHDEKLPSGREQKSIVAAMAALGWKKETRQDGAIWYGRGTGPELKLAGSGMQGYKVAPAAPGVVAALQPESTAPRVVEDRTN